LISLLFSDSACSPGSRVSAFSDVLVRPTGNNGGVPSNGSGSSLAGCASFCPVCGDDYGAGRRRKLVDADCGHARCYECVFRSENCQLCESNKNVDQRQRAQRPHSIVGVGGDRPLSRNGGGRASHHLHGRESGFQSYSSVNSSTTSLAWGIKEALDDDNLDAVSQCSSTMSAASSLLHPPPSVASTVYSGRFDPRRRSLGLLRSENARRPSSSNGNFAGIRNANTRRSAHFARAFSGMSAIREQNTSLEGAETASTSTSLTSPPAHSGHHARRVSGGLKEGEVFVGRRWLLRDILDHCSTDLPTNGGFVVSGGPGTGKTAFLQHVGNGGQFPSASVAVLAAHFCRVDDEASCHPLGLLRSWCGQLYSSPHTASYRRYLDGPEGDVGRLRSRLLGGGDQGEDVRALFKQGLADPLRRLTAERSLPPQPHNVAFLLVDAVDEAESHRSDGGLTVGAFLCHARAMLPAWLKLIVSVRASMADVVKGLPFQGKSLNDDGFDERLAKDLKDYVAHRWRRSGEIRRNATPTLALARRAQQGGCSADDESPLQTLADHLRNTCRGSLLAAKLTLDLIESGRVIVKNSLGVLPQSASQAFMLHLNILFPTQTSYAAVKLIFSICLASLRPMTLRQVYVCVAALYANGDQRENGSGDEEVDGLLPQTEKLCDYDDFLHAYSVVSAFLPTHSDDTVAFVHSSFREWLTGRRSSSDNRFVCDPTKGHEALALWLSRKGDLGAEETLDLAHHVLKSQIFKPGGRVPAGATSREMQALWLCKASADVSRALACGKNVSQPNVIVSKLLLAAGANANGQYDEDELRTPLLSRHAAAGNAEMVRVLLDGNADASASDSRGRTALMLAAEGDRADMCAEILHFSPEVLAQSCNEGSTAMSFAVRADSVNALVLLLDQPAWPGASKSRQVTEAIVSACRFGKRKALEILLKDADGSPNRPCEISQKRPLEVALENDHADVARLLLAAGGDLSSLESPLHASIQIGGSWEMAELLVSAGCGVRQRSAKGRTPMGLAARRGATEIMELLAQRGAPLDEKDVDGVSALSWACIKMQPAAADWLLKHDADAACPDEQGRTPLHHAAFSGCTRAADLLLDKGAPLEVVDSSGLRPIDQAVCCGRRATTLCLLKRGAKLGPATWAAAKDKPSIL